MRNLFERTGGYLVVSDTFESSVFKESFIKTFTTEATGAFRMAFNGRIECIMSKDIKVCGCIGPCTSNKKKN